MTAPAVVVVVSWVDVDVIGDGVVVHPATSNATKAQRRIQRLTSFAYRKDSGRPAARYRAGR